DERVSDRAGSVQEEAPASAADGQVVRSWNQQVITTVRAKALLDADIARCFAMVNAAMYDAVNGIEPRRGFALVPPTPSARGSQAAGAAQAAQDVLAGLFPDQTAAYDAQLALDLGAARGNVDAGREWGAGVGAQVLALRAGDGSSPTETQPAGAG